MSKKQIDITKPIVTRDGRKVSQVVKFDIDAPYTIYGIVEGESDISSWTFTGEFDISGSSLKGYDILNPVEKKVVPLEASDFTGTEIFKHNELNYELVTIRYISGDKIRLDTSEGSSAISFAFLRKSDWQISRDGGKTWSKCEKTVEE